jgi:hypothetical protein
MDILYAGTRLLAYPAVQRAAGKAGDLWLDDAPRHES